MHYVVGLGNPGAEYQRTRHNAGFWVIDELARRGGVELAARDQLRLASACIAAQAAVLIQPQAYMNRSGAALAAVYPDLCAEDLIAVHDDLDLALGTVRVKVGGGSGGHRGVDSLIVHFGSEFTRVRLGIGRPAPGVDPVTHVLTAFAADESAAVCRNTGRGADAVEWILARGAQSAMNTFNQRSPEPPVPGGM